MLRLLLVFPIVFALADSEPAFLARLTAAAEARAKSHVTYDPTYFSIGYPGGDVPADRGVCTDVVIRSYRALGIDLQKEVHEDMAAHFTSYPKIFHLKSPDRNIDHRRVPNLEVFFRRKGRVLAVSGKAEDYAPGDIVTWNLPGGLRHIGIVTSRHLIMHNIGAGDVIEDVLFNWPIAGHFRYLGSAR